MPIDVNSPAGAPPAGSYRYVLARHVGDTYDADFPLCVPSYDEVVTGRAVTWRGRRQLMAFLNSVNNLARATKEGWVDVTDAWNESMRPAAEDVASPPPVKLVAKVPPPTFPPLDQRRRKGA